MSIEENTWDRDWKSAQPALEDCKKEVESRSRRDVPVLRSNQLDAQILDAEINGLLSSQFMRAFAFFKPDVIDKIKPELNAILDILIFRYSIYSMDTTYGNKLQNLKFVDSKLAPLSMKLKLLYGIITVGGKYLWTRLNSMSILKEDWSGKWYTQVWRMITWMEKFLLLANVINFVVFLFDGKYVSVLHRILGLRLIYRTTNMQRQLSFEFMNRQLVWHEFTEFLMFLLPLVSVEKLKNTFSRYFFSPQLVKVPLQVCPICMKDPIDTSYKSTRCGHAFCYYCIKQKLMIDSGFPCPRCGDLIPNIERHQEIALDK